MTQYPEDEFDRAARSRGPKGVHRPAEPTWRKLLPIIAALILGPLLAWGFISALNRDNTTDPEAGPSPTQTAAATGEPTSGVDGEGEGSDVEGEGTGGEGTGADGETGDGEPGEPTEPAVPELAINHEAAVTVYNGARVAGIAGRTSDTLEAEGFTNLSAADYTSAQPTVSTIYYNNAELADTAEAIGEILGIAPRTELAEATDSIAVVLRSDFQE